jgi:hypothetical protein
VRGRTVKDGVLAGTGRLEGVGKLVGESMTAGDGVLEEPGAPPHPATKKTSTLANHAMRVILRMTITLLPFYCALMTKLNIAAMPSLASCTVITNFGSKILSA